MKTMILATVACLTAGASLAATQAPLAHKGEMLQQAGLRAATMARAGLDPFAPNAGTITPPALVSGLMEHTTVNVIRPPVSPIINFKYSAPGFLQSAWFYFSSPSGQQGTYVEYGTNVPVDKQGSLRIENLGGAFSLHSEAGAWTMQEAYLYDFAGNYTYYSADQLAAIFPSLTVDVKNDIAPDTTMPVMVSAHLKTKTVSMSSAKPWFKVELTASDDNSGVSNAYLYVIDPNNNEYYIGGNSATHTGTEHFHVGMNMANMPSSVQGTWTILSYTLCDAAGNCTSNYDQDSLTSLFGTTSFTVTP